MFFKGENWLAFSNYYQKRFELHEQRKNVSIIFRNQLLASTGTTAFKVN